MNRPPAQDARPLVAVVAGLVVVSLLGAVHSPWWLAGMGWCTARAAARADPGDAAGGGDGRVSCRRYSSFACLPDAARGARPRLVRPVCLMPCCGAPLSSPACGVLVGGWLDPRARAVRVLLDCDERGPDALLAQRARAGAASDPLGARGVRPGAGACPRARRRGSRERGDREEAQVSESDSESKEPGTNREGTATQLSVVRAELRLARSEQRAACASPAEPRSAAGVRAGARRAGSRAR